MSENMVSMARLCDGEGAATSWPAGRLAYGQTDQSQAKIML